MSDIQHGEDELYDSGEDLFDDAFVDGVPEGYEFGLVSREYKTEGSDDTEDTARRFQQAVNEYLADKEVIGLQYTMTQIGKKAVIREAAFLYKEEETEQAELGEF